MDNKRKISSMAYDMANDKMYETNLLPSKSSCHQLFDHQKSLTNAVTPYTIRGGHGVHILMNTQSMYTATNMQFVMPQRTKTNLWNDVALRKNLLDAQVFEQTATFVEQQTSLLMPAAQQFAYITNLNGTGQETRKLLFEEKSTFIESQSNMNDSKNRFYNDNHKTHRDSCGNETTIVKTIKNLFSSWIRPIIETTTKFVGTDNASTSSSVPKSKQMQCTEPSGSPSNKNHKTQPMYCDNSSSSNSFFYTSEQSDIFVNFTPETYLDCDDYIDGGEDTIDFVADSTKIQWNSFGEELCDQSSMHSSPNDPIFYDCFNKFENDVLANKLELEQELVPQHESDLVAKDSAGETKSIEVSSSPKSDGEIENVQYGDEELTENCPKYVKPNGNSYRHKRRRRQKHKTGNNRQKGNGAQKKNQHEKLRHEVKMNIHDDIDDIDDCFIIDEDNVTYYYDLDDEEEPDIDLEIVDMVEQKLNCSESLTTPETFTNAKSDQNVWIIETPIPSPEVIPSARIFTNFFRFDNACKQRLMPFRCAEKQLPPVKSSKEQSTSYRPTSETESDDSFIIFEDNKHPRHPSECSDDFIFFSEEDADYIGQCDTTDEDFTDSTDDCDESDDGKLQILNVIKL